MGGSFQRCRPVDLTGKSDDENMAIVANEPNKLDDCWTRHNDGGRSLLFRFGMPYRLRPAKGDYITTESATKDPWDGVYSFLGWLGLAAVLLGTAFQIAGAYLG